MLVLLNCLKFRAGEIVRFPCGDNVFISDSCEECVSTNMWCPYGDCCFVERTRELHPSDFLNSLQAYSLSFWWMVGSRGATSLCTKISVSYSLTTTTSLGC